MYPKLQTKKGETPHPFNLAHNLPNHRKESSPDWSVCYLLINLLPRNKKLKRNKIGIVLPLSLLRLHLTLFHDGWSFFPHPQIFEGSSRYEEELQSKVSSVFFHTIINTVPICIGKTSEPLIFLEERSLSPKTSVLG